MEPYIPTVLADTLLFGEKAEMLRKLSLEQFWETPKSK